MRVESNDSNLNQAAKGEPRAISQQDSLFMIKSADQISDSSNPSAIAKIDRKNELRKQIMDEVGFSDQFTIKDLITQRERLTAYQPEDIEFLRKAFKHLIAYEKLYKTSNSADSSLLGEERKNEEYANAPGRKVLINRE